MLNIFINVFIYTHKHVCMYVFFRKNFINKNNRESTAVLLPVLQQLSVNGSHVIHPNRLYCMSFSTTAVVPVNIQTAATSLPNWSWAKQEAVGINYNNL